MAEHINNSKRLMVELKHDIAARDALHEDNKVLEHEMKRWERELIRLQKEGPGSNAASHINTEGFKKYIEIKQKKETIKEQLHIELEKLRFAGKKLMNELIRTVKQLERRKIDTQSKLHELETSLDLTAQEVAKLEETLKMYEIEFDLRDKRRGGTRNKNKHFL